MKIRIEITSNKVINNYLEFGPLDLLLAAGTLLGETSDALILIMKIIKGEKRCQFWVLFKWTRAYREPHILHYNPSMNETLNTVELSLMNDIAMYNVHVQYLRWCPHPPPHPTPFNHTTMQFAT